MSRLRPLGVSDRFFLISCLVLPRRGILSAEGDATMGPCRTEGPLRSANRAHLIATPTQPPGYPVGAEKTTQLACAFHCGGSLETGAAPNYYAIYGRVNQELGPSRTSMEYLEPAERLYYTINQYRCDDMKALEDKIQQFPKGSSFGFAYDFSDADKDEILEIITFLGSHGYKVIGSHTWSFWPTDSAQ